MGHDQFNFKSFQPSQELEINTKSMLSQLVDFAPLPLGIKAHLSFEDSVYICSVEIKTQFTNFQEEYKCSEPLEAVNLVDQKLRRQIMKWQLDHKIESPAAPAFSPFDTQEF